MTDKATAKGKVNFGPEASLLSISERQSGEEPDPTSTDDLGLEFIRLHSIQAIISAKSASKVFKSKAMVANKRKRLDTGLMEVIKA